MCTNTCMQIYHEGTVGIGCRTITNLRFADDIDGSAGEKEELANLAEGLDKASTAYGMEISAEKTKLVTNNTSGINTEIKVNGQKLETVTSSKYLGSVITDEGSSNLKSHSFKGLQLITSHFWSTVLKTWLDFNRHDPSMPVSTVLWNNRHIKHQGSVLFFKDWITGKILFVKDSKGPSGFLTFQDNCNKLGNSPIRTLEYNVVRAAVNTFLHSVDGCDTADTELFDLPPFCNRKINMVKDFRKVVISMHDCPMCKWFLA